MALNTARHRHYDDIEFAKASLELWDKIDKAGLAKIGELPGVRPPGVLERNRHIELWVRGITMLADKFNISEELRQQLNDAPLEIPHGNSAEHPTMLALHKLSAEAELYELIESNYGIPLDEGWKAKVTSYISHIRTAVSKAEMDEALRERIFARLNDLQRAIDLNLVPPVQALSELFLGITEAMNKGPST